MAKKIKKVQLPDGEILDLGGTGGGASMFDTKLVDHELTFEESEGWALQGTYVYKDAVVGSRYGYPTFIAKCIEEKSQATATETVLGDNTVTLYTNANGHIFYDIADKEAIDAWYETYGTAWYYGVDENAERIFLPRNKWFIQPTDDVSKVNSVNEAGLPNIEGHFTIITALKRTGSSGAFRHSTSTGETGGVGSGTNFGSQGGCTYYIDASRSSSIYSNSDTVQPQSLNQLLYICVGNTSVNEALTDVIDITTTENDTLPLGYSTYQADNLSSAGWLKSTGFFESGLTYITFYNEYRTRIGEKFSGGFVRSVDDTYTDYDLVIDEVNQMFRLPIISDKRELIDKKEATDDDSTWYNLYSDGWCEQGGRVTGLSTWTGSTTLIKSYRDDSYDVQGTMSVNDFTSAMDSYNYFVTAEADTTSMFRWATVGHAGTQSFRAFQWQASGYTTITPNDFKLNRLYYKVGNAVQHLEVIDMLHQAELNNPFFYGMYQYFQTEPNNASWLASLNQWNSKGIYTDYYNWILENVGKDYFKLSTEEYTDYDWVVNEDEETFRLPVKVKGASGSAVAGNGMTLGLNNGEQNFGLLNSSGGVVGRSDVYGMSAGSNGSSSVDNGQSFAVTTDATKSGIETSTDGLTLYFYVGEVIQNANLINAGRALEKLARIGSAYMGKPSNRYIDLTLNASGSTYTAPADGWVYLNKQLGGTSIAYEMAISVNDDLYREAKFTSTGNLVSTNSIHIIIPVIKGAVFKPIYNLTGNTLAFRFIYAEGSK